MPTPGSCGLASAAREEAVRSRDAAFAAGEPTVGFRGAVSAPSEEATFRSGAAACTAGPRTAGRCSRDLEADTNWELFCLDRNLDPKLGEPQKYADEEFEALREGLDKSYPCGEHAQGLDKSYPYGEGHRMKKNPELFGVWTGLVTRVISAKDPEFRSAPCVSALDKELANLRKRGVWDESTVCEWSSLKGSTAMCGRLFAIMGEKNAESMDPSSRSYKARVVFAGNPIQTTDGTPAWE
eukprot:16215489-Heterocapsa_arctica.AAC.1